MADVANTTPSPSRLLSIPAELRIEIYNLLLQHLLINPEHHDTYVLPNEWPKQDFSAYRTLHLVCKHVNREVKDLFFTKYLDNMTIYFDNALELRALMKRLRVLRRDHPLRGLRVSLRTECQVHDTSDEEADVQYAIYDFMTEQLQADRRSLRSICIRNALSGTTGWDPGDYSYCSYETKYRDGEQMNIMHIPGPRATGLEVTRRYIEGFHDHTAYDELAGTVGDLKLMGKYGSTDLEVWSWFDDEKEERARAKEKAANRRTTDLLDLLIR